MLMSGVAFMVLTMAVAKYEDQIPTARAKSSSPRIAAPPSSVLSSD
jgi:hypothetical protein